MTRFLPFLALLGLCQSFATNHTLEAADPAPTTEQLEFFEKQVRPLLAQHCYECHSVDAKRIEGSLLLDSRAAHLRGGDSGPAIEPGKPDESLLIEAVLYESYEMPPKGKLPQPDIEILRRWIEMGSPWPDEPEPTTGTKTTDFDLASRKAEFWLWQPVTNPNTPKVRQDEWPRNDIDRFILARLEDSKISPAEDAERAALLRRIYFDLIGLPPNPDEIKAFLADPSAQAVDTVVNRLLDSEHFGERWGRHWLDLVRYAESRGHEFDNDTPNAFQYRDYVIRAFNEDVPYDQFVREHIAGDLIAQPRLHPTEKFNESVLGTGFWFLGEWVHSPVDIRKDEADRFDNMIDVMSKTFLGVTVACARCHDHKFDAISTADYYSLSGFLQSSDYRQVRYESLEHNRQIASQLAEVDKKYQSQVLDYLASLGMKPPKQTSYLNHEAIIVDYGSLPQSQFLQDGFIFGAAPRRHSLAYLNGGKNPSVEIATHASAVNDPAWFGLQSITEGAIQNSSALAKLPKSGRTLRTPTFEVQNGKVNCLVNGTGHIVACVDSHRLVAGPLHKQTIRAIKKNERWVTMNLERYIGHRIHLEFIPASGSQLSLRLVAQGLDAKSMAFIDRQLADMDEPFQQFAATAESVLNGKVDVNEHVFADFESGTYEGWQVAGEAFGDRPQTLKTIASYQGNINRKGSFFVNSHNIRNGGDVREGDSLTGTLTSKDFKIDFDRIEFLIGGGSHVGLTCMNLLVDGKVVRTATGDNNNQMSVKSWDVRQLAGKSAKLQIVDKHQSGWGNVGVDHIVFQTIQSGDPVDLAGNRILQAWQRERSALAERIQKRSRVAPAMLDGTGEDDHILIRGNASKPGDLEPRHFLTAVSGDAPISIRRGSGRLELARQINSPTNPLTSRVIANRIWHHLMGRGIVATVDDFGVLGQRPSHPELLDHLAVRFVQNGQSIKQMIRYIIASRTYQMSSRPHSASVKADPKNLMWHHCPPRRLQGEVIRDALLAISGRLNPTQLGPPVPIHLTSFMEGRGRPKKNGPLDGNGRRSIYISVRRNFLSPFMLTFDTPTPFSSMGRRNVSNVPAQALILMNDPLVVDLSRSWGQRALREVPGESLQAMTARLEWLYQTGFARVPTKAELKAALSYLHDQTRTRKVASDDMALWADVAHALVNTKEFIFLK